MSLSAATDGYLSSGGGGAGGPVITAATPLVGSTIAVDDELVVTVESEDGDVQTVDLVEIRLIGSGVFVEIYDGAAFAAPYLGSDVDITAGVATITIVADDGWIVGVAEVRVTATDDAASQNADEVGSWFFSADEGDEDEEGPDPVPEDETFGEIVETIDIVARAIDRLPEYLRP